MRLTEWVPWMKKNEIVEDDFFTPFDVFEKQMKLFEPWITERNQLKDLKTTFSPKLNIAEDNSHFEVVAELPGLDISDIQMEYKGDTLYLTGEKRMEERKEEKNYYRMETSYGHFSRAIPFPAGVNPDQIEAKFKNGILKISIPKPMQIKENKKTIEITHS